MEEYIFRALDEDGKKVSDTIEADNETEAVRQIKRRYPILLSIRKKKAADSFLEMEIGGKRLDKKALVILCSQCAVILKSGMPVDECMLLVSRQIKDKKLKSMLTNSAEDIRRGVGIADSFQRNYKGLPTVFIETIRAGELSGNMEYAFEEMQHYYDKSHKTGQKIRQALSYPIFVLIVAIVVLIVVMMFVVPTMTATFRDLGGELPGITKMLIALSEFMRHYIWILAVVASAIFLALRFALKTRRGRLLWGRIQLKLPVVGPIFLLSGSAQFASTMNTLLRSGMILGNALEIAARVLDNRAMRQDVSNMVEDVYSGQSFGDCLRRTTTFPDTLKEMCSIGEETGELTSTLETVSGYFDNEVENATKQAIQMIEPMIMVMMAAFAGFIVLSIYLPMFMMYDLM
ncbi:MAG: type II secretion system F family protein [Eubacteriales bacterium]|nr:type II secretion system F family protein [Eubacteriales bacterium]